jgi:elongation factor P
MAIPENLKKGAIISLDGQPYVVLDYWEARTAQRRGTLHVKLRDVKRGKVVERTLDDRSNADVMESHVHLLKYLYADAAAYHFMDTRSYEQVELPRALLGDGAVFLVDEGEYRVLYLEEQPVVVEIPPAVTFEVMETPPSAGTASGNTNKTARLKGGLEVSVPRFIKAGDRVRISTETREYLGKES